MGLRENRCGKVRLIDYNFINCFLFVKEQLLHAFPSDTERLKLSPLERFSTGFLFPMSPLWANNFFYYGIFFIALFSILAADLNSEGFRCLSILSQEDAQLTDPSLGALEWHCFIVTNSYVYSLFGIAIGAILLFIWYLKGVNQSR